MRYQLRSWWLTPILAEVVAEVIGLSVVAGFFWTKGTDWFHKYYITILGYYVVASITLGHYFKTNGKPNIHGFFRHVIAILCGIEFYYLHEDLYLHWFGIDPKLLQAAHFLWIVFGFFFASFDDTFFWGFLSKWMKFNWIKAIFWLLVVWLFWYIFFYTPLVSDAKGTFQSEKFNQTLAVMQWIIMVGLSIGIHFHTFVDSFAWKNDIVRGLVSCVIAGGIGIPIAYISFAVFKGVWKDKYTKAEIWHHVLYFGTSPLAPLIEAGLYTNNFRNQFNEGKEKLKDRKVTGKYPKLTEVNSGKKAILRGLNLLIGTLLQYFAYQVIICKFNAMGDAHHEWIHKELLTYNFSVRIVQLTHHWFNSRIFFVKPVYAPPKIESEFEPVLESDDLKEKDKEKMN